MKKTNLKIVTQSNTAHYLWGAHCDGWHFLKSNSLSIIRESMPKGTSEKLHYHLQSQQFFYILSGEATFYIEEQSYRVQPHKGLHIPPKTKHKIANETNSALEFMVISEPNAHGDRIDLEN